MSSHGAPSVGPVPAGEDPDQYDRHRRRILWSLPTGLYVLGSRDASGRRNLMTLNWAMQVATAPKLVAVSVEAAALTRQLVDSGGCFSLNVLPRSERAIVRRFVKPLDDPGDPAALGGSDLRPGGDRPPVLAAAVAWLDCDVRHRVDTGSHILYTGEVVGCGGEPGEAEILRMEDTRMNYGG